MNPGKEKKRCHCFCFVLTVVTAPALAVNLSAERLQQYVSAGRVKTQFVILQVATGKWCKG